MNPEDSLAFEALQSRLSASDTLRADLRDGGTDARLRILQSAWLPDNVKLAILDEATGFRKAVACLLDEGGALASIDHERAELLQDLSAALEQQERNPDRQKLSEWLADVMKSDSMQRKQALDALFADTWEQSPAHFLTLLRAITDADLLSLSLNRTGNGDLTTIRDAFLAPLDCEQEMMAAAVALVRRMAQTQPDRYREWTGLITGPAGETQPEDMTIDMTAAGLPDTHARSEHYASTIERMLQSDRELFRPLSYAFKQEARLAFGEGREAFYTKGTTDAFRSLSLEMLGTFPDTSFVIASPGEYRPLFSSLRSHLCHVPLAEPPASESDLLGPLDEAIEACLAEKNGSARQVVVVVSSAPRMGGALFDVERIRRLIDAVNDRHAGADGRKPVHLWVDASQDARLHTAADIVFYSKRTGGGMVVIDDARYPKNEQEDIREAVRLRSGYDARQIGRLIASLHSLRTGQRYGLRELTEHPALWDNPSNASFVRREVDEAKRFLESDPDLASRFRLIVPERTCATDMLLRLEPIPGTDIDLLGLQRYLAERNVRVGTFSLKEHRYGHGPVIDDLLAQTHDPATDPHRLVHDIGYFENYYKDWIVWSLLPVDRSNPDAVKRHFLDAVGRHDFFRLRMTVHDRAGMLKEFLERLKEALQDQNAPLSLAASAPPPQN